MSLTAVRPLWPTVLATVTPDVRERVRLLAVAAERRRADATYNTGSIAEDEACALWALAEYIKARVVIEVGTFIGMSTTALASASTVESVYTCDASNDCLPNEGAIRTYPKQTSREMLRHLVKLKVRADLCFFDGVLNHEDSDLLTRLVRADTVYAFHDYNYGPKIRKARGGRIDCETVARKGIGNVSLLRPQLPQHVLIEPMDGTTVALLVPESRL